MYYYRLTYDKIHKLHDTRIWLTKYHTNILHEKKICHDYLYGYDVATSLGLK